jgi:acyl dehydratase
VRPQARDPVITAQHASRESLSFKGLEVGQRGETQRIFTAADLAEYAALTGDTNPVYTDAGYARRLNLAGPLIPGGLLAGLFSTLLGTRLPGRGTNYLKQHVEFLAPAYREEELTSSVEIIRIRAEKQLVNLSTLCTNPAGEVVCRGEALVLVSDVGDQSHR